MEFTYDGGGLAKGGTVTLLAKDADHLIKPEERMRVAVAVQGKAYGESLWI
jgi:hypothetical protein